ncbi:MAG: proprotein convertase P-domain-containing protein [Pseudomonadota bacterium]
MRTIVVAIGLIASAGAVHAATITQSETLSPVIIVDDGEASTTTTIVQSGIITEVTFTANLTSANDEIDDAGNPNDDGGDEFTDELFLFLTSPSGTAVDLVLVNTYQGSSEADPFRFEVTFDDDAAVLVGAGSTSSPESGTFRPVGLLSDFDGEDAMGVWTVTIGDSSGSDPKSLNSFTLEIETLDASVPVPAALPLLTAGLLLIGFAGRRRG